MKEEILKIAKDLEQGAITTKTARHLLLGLFGVSGMVCNHRDILYEVRDGKRRCCLCGEEY